MADLRTLSIYALPFTGGAVMLFVVQFFFLKYATDVLLLPPALVGTLFAVSKLADAVTDPFIGLLSDRSRTRGGRKLWLFVSTPLLAASFYFLWVPPAQYTLIWLCIALVAFYMTFTGYNIPHLALAAELNAHAHAKTRFYGARQMVETVGMLTAFVLIQIISDSADPRESAGELMLIVSMGMGLFLLGTPLFVRERAITAPRAAFLPSAGELMRNTRIMRLLWVWFWVFAATSSLGVMGPYAAEYVLGRPDLIAVLPGSFVVAGLASIPFWIALAKRYGKSRIFTAGLAGAGLSLLALPWIPSAEVSIFVALTSCCGVFLSAPSILGPSLLADAAGVPADNSAGERQGFYFSLFVLSGKVGAAAVTAIIGVLIAAAGYVPNEVQSDTVRVNLLYVFVGLPALGCLIGILAMIGRGNRV